MTKRILCFILLLTFLLGFISCETEKPSVVDRSPLNSEVSVLESSITEESTAEESSLDDIPQPRGFYILFIDVGQADASLIMCDGHYMLIDGGNVDDSNRIYSVLKSRGVEHLDYVIGTHAHEDHVGGITAAFSACTVGQAFSPVTVADNVPFNNFKRII